MRCHKKMAHLSGDHDGSSASEAIMGARSIAPTRHNPTNGFLPLQPHGVIPCSELYNKVASEGINI